MLNFSPRQVRPRALEPEIIDADLWLAKYWSCWISCLIELVLADGKGLPCLHRFLS